ncbi:hypothetical protein FHR25_005325 [Yokenella regensburgei]|nr:hypothetical protein FHR25_005325 [Yokenella regensburgei]
MKVIDAGVRKALREGGGNHDGALRALETMQRSGTMGKGPDMSIRALPEVMKISTATETDPAAVASLQASAFNFGLNEKDAHAALSTATTMSQHGAVNMSLLAKMGPEALESAKSAGWYGRKGYSETLALFEATARGANAEHPEMAATYTTNLLSELSSPTLANNFSRLEHGRGKSKKGIDIRALIRADAAKGLSPLDTVDRAIRSIDEHDPQFVALEKQIARTTDPDAKAQLVARRDQIHGQNVGKIFTNEYSRLGFLNWERNKDYYHGLVKEGNEQFEKPEGETSADMDFALKRDSTEFKEQQMKNEAINSSNKTIGPVAELYGNVAKAAAELSEKFPVLTTAVMGATSAFETINSFGGGLLTAWAGKKLWDRIRGGGSPGTSGASVANDISTVAEDAAKSGSKWLKPLRVLNPVGDVLMAGSEINSRYLRREEDRIKDVNDAGYSVKDQKSGLELHPYGFMDAFDEMRKFFSDLNAKPSKPLATTPYAPQAPRQPIVNNIYLDSREITDAVLRRVDVDSRRQ